jgi:2-(1,2-epoxy-1,2-dihydrophenyl)acetyl-CoA isomerase
MDEAPALGLVDELAAPEELLARAQALAVRLAQLPPLALNRTRRVARAGLVAALDPESDARLATELWFGAETQAGMRALVQRLAKK